MTPVSRALPARAADATRISTDPRIAEIIARYEAGEHIHIELEGRGLLTIDRSLPFLLLYRTPTSPDAGTRQLLIAEASYLAVAPTPEAEAEAAELVRALAKAGARRFGAFLVIEVWSGTPDTNAFTIYAPEKHAPSTIQVLREGLASIALPRSPGSVDDNRDDAASDASEAFGASPVRVICGPSRSARGRAPLLDMRAAFQSGTLLLGIEVPPVYRENDSTLFPVFHRRFRAALSRALRRAVHDFIRVQTNAGINSYRMLAPRRVGGEVWEADRLIAGIEQSYDLLMLVAPMNTNAAWEEFRAGGFQREPAFHYRLLPVDPDDLKRRLFAIDLESVTDPAIAFLLRDKRDELDTQISLLSERNSPAFLYSSIKLYRAPSPALLEAANAILQAVPAEKPQPTKARTNAEEFAALAEAEIEAYRKQYPAISAVVQIRPDVAGLMVSRGNVLISDQLSIDTKRADALLQHEVGTHVLTWFNGAAQPLQQLRYGLADYDEMQEGLGVFAEYLVGGITAARLRTIAARVIAVNTVHSGATFMETFSTLTTKYGISDGAAFDITERVHESGGFTRDLIYLRGLMWILDYVHNGGDLLPLYMGKFAPRHIEILNELQERSILGAAPLRPRFLDRPDVAIRLDRARRGIGWHELINHDSA